MTTIRALDVSDDQLTITLDSGPIAVPWMWIRDHSRDRESFDAHTSQREVDTFSLDPSLRGRASLVDDCLRVVWDDDSPDSVVPAHVFAEMVNAETADINLWSDPADAGVQPIDHDRLFDDPTARASWVGDIVRCGFGLVRGVPAGRDATAALANRLGYVRRTIFGDLWTLSAEIEDHADSAYGNATLEPHTDGSYSHDGPGLQLFVCQERTGTGGESVLVDGFAVAEDLRSADESAFDLLTDVSVPAHYIEDGVHLRATRPTIRLDPGGKLLQLTFNNYDRSPFLLEPERMQRWYDAYGLLHSLLSDRDRWWTQRLEPGDALIFDNWRCLHGRMGFTGRRVFEGCYLNHEELESRLRVGGTGPSRAGG